jgi:protein-tyrosine phosphatase
MMDLLRRVRRTPERLLHPVRRRKALELLRRRPPPKSILVLCHGNICRSPLAAALLARELVPHGIGVQSAGFIGFNRPSPAEAVTAAKQHGVALAEHRSRLVTTELARTAGLIVVMDPTQRRLMCERYGRRPGDVLILGDLDPEPVETRTIRDPVNERRDVFDQVYARIARCVGELVAALREAAS